MNTEITTEGKKITAVLNGRFTTDETERFLKTVEPLMNASQSEIVMDLSGLDFISSAGIRCFVMLLKAVEANESTLSLKNLTPQIKDIFSLIGLIDKFRIE